MLDNGAGPSNGPSQFDPGTPGARLARTWPPPGREPVPASPDFARSGPRAYHDDKGIVTMAWSPLGGSRTDLFTRPTVTEIAERHGKSPAQIVLRWHMELGLVAIPRSSNRERLVQNLDIFDF